MQLNGKKIVVTGGAGFIGSELCRQLADGGARVVAVDNLISGKRENLVGVNEVRLEVADIRETNVMRALFRGADIVYHLACRGVRHSLHAPLENHEINATASLGLLRVAREVGVPRFVHVSSSEVYGTARYAPMDENHPTFPETVYGASKLAGECYARAYFRSYGYPTVVVRPFNAYGPRCHHEGDSGEVIPKFMLRALADYPLVIFGDGTQTRDFTFVADIARGILLAGTCEAAIGRTINLGSGQEISILDLAAAVGRTLKRSIAIEHTEPRPGDVRRLCANSTQASELLDFSPQLNLETGLARLADWYASLGAAPEDLLTAEVVRNWEKA